jgi:hypothetical protein
MQILPGKAGSYSVIDMEGYLEVTLFALTIKYLANTFCLVHPFGSTTMFLCKWKKITGQIIGVESN